MATVFTHPIPVLAIGLGLGTRSISTPLLVAGLVFSVLPDADVVLRSLSLVPAKLLLGHRGLTHSLTFALGAGLLGAFLAPFLRTTGPKAFWVCFLAVLSHIGLDLLTTGGRYGIALLAPWSDTRFTLPWAPIKISPFANGFFTQRGLEVILCELQVVWLPSFMVFILLYAQRKLRKYFAKNVTEASQHAES